MIDGLYNTAVITLLLLACYKLYKHYTTPQHYYVDKETKDLIDKLYDLKSQHSKILQFIFDYDTLRDNNDKSYDISWYNEMGEQKSTTIFRGTGKWNTDKKYKANLRKSAEAYEQYLSQRITELITELSKHNSRLQEGSKPQFPLWRYKRTEEEQEDTDKE